MVVRYGLGMLALGALIMLPYIVLAGSAAAFAMIFIGGLVGMVVLALVMLTAIKRRRPVQNRGASR